MPLGDAGSGFRFFLPILQWYALRMGRAEGRSPSAFLSPFPKGDWPGDEVEGGRSPDFEPVFRLPTVTWDLVQLPAQVQMLATLTL
jgi:hypothetical protein